MGLWGQMRHRNTELLLGYWTKLKGASRVPARADIDPRAVKRLLPDLFIIDRMARNRFTYALAGTRMCWLYGRELRETNFLAHWSGVSERQVRDLLEESLIQARPVAIYGIAETSDHRTLRAEILFLPIADSRGNVTRLLGCMTPLDPVMALGERKLVHQWLVSSDKVGDVAPQRSIDDEDDRPGDPPPQRQSGVPYLRLVVSRGDASGNSKFTEERLLEPLWAVFSQTLKPAT